MDLAKCEICKWSYPTVLVNIMRSSASEFNLKAMCGICGLEATNTVHGTNRQKFDGEVAELMRQQAILWREKHPYDNPMLKGKKRIKNDTTGTGTK